MKSVTPNCRSSHTLKLQTDILGSTTSAWIKLFWDTQNKLKRNKVSTV